MSNQFNNLSPKFSFLLGLVGGILIIGTLGFLILLGILFKEKGLTNVNSPEKLTKTNVQTETTTPKTPTPQRTTEITLREVSSRDHIRGDTNAPLTLVEYSDLECPFCKRFHPTMLQVMDEYKGKVRWVYRHFPLDSLHPKARKEAEATECAAELGGNDSFWAYLDRLFEVTPSNNGLDPAELPQIAQDVGLDRTKFSECLASGKFAQHIQEDYQDAVSAGGRGTPYNVVIDAEGNKTPVSGAVPYSQLKQIIDSLL